HEAAGEDARDGVRRAVQKPRQVAGDEVRGGRARALRLQLVLVAGRVDVVQVVEAGRGAAVVGRPVVGERTREAREGPGGLLVADHVVGKADLEAVGRVGVPGGDGRIRPLRAAGVAPAPGA